MTVKEIFELRRQGKIEEAYDAIRPMYAIHKGRYTSLCMFWTAADIFKKRIDEGRTDEAAKIYEALKRVLPYIKDSDPRPDGQPQSAAKAQPDDGIPGLGIDKEPHRITDSAAAFMQSAACRLTVARQLDKQQAEKKRSSEADFRDFRNFATFRNPQEEAISASQEENPSTSEEEYLSNSSNSPLKESQEEESQEEESQAEELRSSEADFRDFRNFATSRNPQEEAIFASQEEDLNGHLGVSLVEGIIRPIEGLNAIQRVILACVVGHPGYSVPRISESTGIPQTIVDRNIDILIDRSLIEPRKGELNTTDYYPI